MKLSKDFQNNLLKSAKIYFHSIQFQKCRIRKSPQKQTAIRAKEAFTESLRLPRDVMLGASILTLIGDTELLVENYRGILEYTQECILLQGKHSRIRIEGCCLKIVYYTNEDMKIAGKISGVRYL